MLVRAAYTIAFLCLVGAAGWGLHGVLTTQDDDGFLQWRDPAVTAAGRVLYASHCASCHGMPDGSVKPTVNTSAKAPPLHDASGHTWEHPDFALFQLVRDGVAVANCVPLDPELMPKFKGIVSDAELVAILSYIKSTWPRAVRQNHDRVNMMYGPYNRAVRKLIDTGSGEHG
ncbi:MAG: hypothetical protein BGN94_20175 [Rhizobiales bacterium 68-8]|nr:MAG: hypothetical protein BGN94_20175 [Rhizobiales bacterium 68-8]